MLGRSRPCDTERGALEGGDFLIEQSFATGLLPEVSRRNSTGYHGFYRTNHIYYRLCIW